MEIILYQPEIPPNTGNVARLCAATRTPLHLIEPLGFSLDDKHLKRAGLDYWYEVDIRHHESFEAFLNARRQERRIFAFSRHASVDYTRAAVDHGDYLLFGRETAGAPQYIVIACASLLP